MVCCVYYDCCFGVRQLEISKRLVFYLAKNNRSVYNQFFRQSICYPVKVFFVVIVSSNEFVVFVEDINLSVVFSVNIKDLLFKDFYIYFGLHPNCYQFFEKFRYFYFLCCMQSNHSLYIFVCVLLFYKIHFCYQVGIV